MTHVFFVLLTTTKIWCHFIFVLHFCKGRCSHLFFWGFCVVLFSGSLRVNRFSKRFGWFGKTNRTSWECDKSSSFAASIMHFLLDESLNMFSPTDWRESVYVFVLLQLEIYLLPSCFHCWPGLPRRCEYCLFSSFKPTDSEFVSRCFNLYISVAACSFFSDNFAIL